MKDMVSWRLGKNTDQVWKEIKGTERSKVVYEWMDFNALKLKLTTCANTSLYKVEEIDKRHYNYVNRMTPVTQIQIQLLDLNSHRLAWLKESVNITNDMRISLSCVSVIVIMSLPKSAYLC